MNRKDYEADPCHCPECTQSGTSARPLRRDPKTGAWNHGEAARRYWASFDDFWARVKRVSKAKGMDEVTAKASETR